MKKFLIAVISTLCITETSLAAVTYLTCGPNNEYAGVPTQLSATYQKAPYNIVYEWWGSTGLNVGLWQGVYYTPNFVFSSYLDAYNFCSALKSECLNHDKASGGTFQAWTNVSGFAADIIIQMNDPQGPNALCSYLLQNPPANPYYALGCADTDGFKLSGAPSQQELQKYGNLIQNNNGSTSLQGALEPSLAAPQQFALGTTFSSTKDAAAFCNTMSAQCKAQFPKGNGSVGVYSPNNNVYPYPLSVAFMASGMQQSANCAYFPF